MERFTVDESKMADIKIELLGDSGNSFQFEAKEIKEEIIDDVKPGTGFSYSFPEEGDGDSGSHDVDEGWRSIVKVEGCEVDGAQVLLNGTASNSAALQNLLQEQAANNVRVSTGDCRWMAEAGGADEAGPSGNTESKPVTSKVSGPVPSEDSTMTSESSQPDEAMEEAVDDRTDRKRFACEHCDYSCSKAFKLKVHSMKHSGERPFACKVCDYKSSRQDTLKQHMLSHLSQMPYACEVCDYKTNTAGKLKRHVNKHFDELPHSCDLCGYKCAFMDLMKKHMRTHTGEKPYACDVCDYRCTQTCHLSRHKLTHSTDKRLLCKICDFRTTHPSSLKIHMRKHTGEKPYFCDFCDYRCNVSGQMTKHKRTHTGETPYACDLCTFTCKQPGNLRVHKRRHIGERPYTCQFCSMKFYVNGDLKRHIQRKHLKDSEPDDIAPVDNSDLPVAPEELKRSRAPIVGTWPEIQVKLEKETEV